MFFFKNHTKTEAGRLVLDLFCFLKSFLWGKSKWPAVWFQCILIVLKLAYLKNKLYKTLDFWSRDMLNFNFLEKSLGIVSLPHFVYDVLRKILLMLYSIYWPSFIVWLRLLLEILGNVYIAIVCFPGCDVINFEINVSF